MKSLLRGETQPERALIALVPHTTSLRCSRFEVPLSVQFLRFGVFDAQSLVTDSACEGLRFCAA